MRGTVWIMMMMMMMVVVVVGLPIARSTIRSRRRRRWVAFVPAWFLAVLAVRMLSIVVVVFLVVVDVVIR